MDELMNVADASSLDTKNIGESSGENTTTTVHTIALDSFFDFDVRHAFTVISHQSGLFLFYTAA